MTALLPRAGLILAPVLLVAACRTPWPAENVAAFERSCVGNARKTRPAASEASLAAYCDCAAERLQASYTLDEFTAMEKRSLAENKPAMELVRVVEECAGLVR